MSSNENKIAQVEANVTQALADVANIRTLVSSLNDQVVALKAQLEGNQIAGLDQLVADSASLLAAVDAIAPAPTPDVPAV